MKAKLEAAPLVDAGFLDIVLPRVKFERQRPGTGIPPQSQAPCRTPGTWRRSPNLGTGKTQGPTRIPGLGLHPDRQRPGCHNLEDRIQPLPTQGKALDALGLARPRSLRHHVGLALFIRTVPDDLPCRPCRRRGGRRAGRLPGTRAVGK